MTDRYEPNVEVITQSDAATAAEVIETHDVLPLERTADPLTQTLTSAARALLTRQSEKGFWHFDLEADATIPSEYLMLHHFLGTVDEERQQRIVAYLRRRQLDNGSWSLFEGGPGNISATVKAYFALKLAGVDPDEEFMQRARRWVHANGGAEKVNVFTRIALALFGQMPWRVVPAMPIEFMFLPNWWFINLKKVSYWSRCVIVPLLIIMAAKPVHRVAPEAGIRELFLQDPDSLRHLDHFSSKLFSLENAFIALDRVLRLADGLVPRFIRSRAVRRAEIWMREHMQGSGGIGAIYPAMANSVMMDLHSLVKQFSIYTVRNLFMYFRPTNFCEQKLS